MPAGRLQQSGRGKGAPAHHWKQTRPARSAYLSCLVCCARVRLSSAERNWPVAPGPARRPISQKVQQGKAAGGASASPEPKASDSGAAGRPGARPPARVAPLHGPLLKWASLHARERAVPGARKAVPRCKPGRAPLAQGARSARPGGSRGCPAWSIRQRPPGVGRAPTAPAARRLLLAYRYSPAGPVARRSQGTPSCTAATTPATAPRSSKRAAHRYAPWLSKRCCRTGKPSCPPAFESALSARPAPWLASPLQAPPRSTPNLSRSAAQALDTPRPPLTPQGHPSLQELPIRFSRSPKPALPLRSPRCFRERPKAPEEAHPSF